MKLHELQQQKETLKAEVRSLLNENKIDEADAKMTEVRKLDKAIEIETALQTEEKKEVENQVEERAEKKEETKEVDKKDLELRAFNKAVAGKQLTTEERAVVSTGQISATDAKGGFLVPKAQMMELLTYRRQLISLKELCTIYPVSLPKGSMPIGLDPNKELVNFDEINEINQSDVSFSNIGYATSDYGDIIPVSNTLIADEVVGILPYISRRFNEKAVRTENSKILGLLKGATKKTGADYKAITTQLNKTLDPAISALSVIITNQDGFDYLDNLTDSMGRPLLTDSLTQGGAKLFKGRTVIVLPNSQFTSLGDKKFPFCIGSTKDFLAFFDRQEVEIATSNEAGFTKNATLVRVIERFDVQKVDNDAMVYLEITIV